MGNPGCSSESALMRFRSCFLQYGKLKLRNETSYFVGFGPNDQGLFDYFVTLKPAGRGGLRPAGQRLLDERATFRFLTVWSSSGEEPNVRAADTAPHPHRTAPRR